MKKTLINMDTVMKATALTAKQIASRKARAWSFLTQGKKGSMHNTIKEMFCTGHTGKMSGMISISTSPIVNPICQARAKNPNCICHFCYAMAMQDQYSDLAKKLVRNTEILAHTLLNREDIPVINNDKFGGLRFESFGDLMSTEQVYNYFLIASVNGHMPAALWTKNPQFIKKAMEAYGIKKPSNLVIIYSSKAVNKAEPIPAGYENIIDKVFTVYDPESACSNNIDINCGARDCSTCMRCYNTDTEKDISELLK